MSLMDQQWCPTSVQVTVLQARGLRIKGKSGTNDAYAIMQVGKEKFQTSVVEKTVAPVWKEEAAFDLPPGSQGGERGTLHVHVMHRALVGPDKLLGQAVINLLQRSEDTNLSKTEWFKLVDKTGKADKDRGEVLLDIQFMRNNMTASMCDLSAAGKSRSRLGKFKDKVRGKKKDSDTASGVVPSFAQVLTDSEEEANGDGEVAAGTDEKKKKNKMKSLFSPKSNLQRNMSQSLSVLPASSSLSGSPSSGLTPEASEGKKKFKFMIHKRSGSSDNKDSFAGIQKHSSAEQNMCINGSHVYCEEPQARTARIGSNFSLASSGHGSMEDVPERRYSPWREDDEEMDDGEDLKENVDEEEEEERMKKGEVEERLRRQQEETEKLAKETRRKEEEERKRALEEKVRSEENERKRREEEKRRQQKEEERLKLEEEKKRIEMEEKVKREEEQKARLDEERRKKEVERVRREKEEQEEKMRLEEQERKRKEEEKRRQREEERIRKEEERAQKEKEESERLEEEKRRKEEQERLEKEERVRKEEQERIRVMEERMRQEEEERLRKEKEEVMRLAEEKKRREEERMQKEREERIKREEQERVKMEEERMRKEKEDMMRREEEERIKKEKEERIKKEEQERIRMMEERMRQEEEERVKKEKEEAMRLEEEKRRREEEERVRKEKEEAMRLEEEERRLEEEERVRKEKEEAMRLEEEKRTREKEERVRKEKEERMRLEEEKRRREEEEKLKVKEEEKKAERKRKEDLTRRLEREQVTREMTNPTNPFDEACDPLEENPNSPVGPKLSNVQGCRSAGSSVEIKTVTADEKDLISVQREKRPAPQPPGRNQAEQPCQRDADVSARHAAQTNKQSNDKDIKTASVLPQRSVQMIAPVSRSPVDTESTESSMQSGSPKGAASAAVHTKGPAPPRPRSVDEEPSSKPKGTLSIGSEAKRVQKVYGLNPFEDDEDENEAQEDIATSQNKMKSSKVVHAPPRPAGTSAPNTGVTQICDPESEAKTSVRAQKSPVQEAQAVAQNTGKEASIRKEGPPTTSRRLQPVKPLNPLEQQCVSVDEGEKDKKSTGILGGIQLKAKVNDAGVKGPFSQLTQEELISMVLKQKKQLSERDHKISELEQYIDNLLVRVMEEKPSILMSLSCMTKAV